MSTRSSPSAATRPGTEEGRETLDDPRGAGRATPPTSARRAAAARLETRRRSAIHGRKAFRPGFGIALARESKPGSKRRMSKPSGWDRQSGRASGDSRLPAGGRCELVRVGVHLRGARRRAVRAGLADRRGLAHEHEWRVEHDGVLPDGAPGTRALRPSSFWDGVAGRGSVSVGASSGGAEHEPPELVRLALAEVAEERPFPVVVLEAKGVRRDVLEDRRASRRRAFTHATADGEARLDRRSPPSPPAP